MRTGLQTVEVDTGFADAVIGADAQVLAGGVPVFLLENWRAGPEPDTAWLRAVPSRMLDSRNAVVEFQGRTAELAGLHRWLSPPDWPDAGYTGQEERARRDWRPGSPTRRQRGGGRLGCPRGCCFWEARP
ncbi:hypothetical protein [Micromonospora sp. NPDC049171]|uniref:hypothetical protein n=1 Tax=Micromonospora sp. NPDC049171 TaxID=3155770 RepID=UPI003409BD47